MNILMVTNTFTPFVGGVARSVESFTEACRRRGHRVLVVAPAFRGTPPGEVDVVRVPAVQKFNGGDFAVRLPIPGLLFSALEAFHPDVVHSHHPYLLGDTALRIAAARSVPIVFTHHTFYEKFTHFVPGDSPALRRFVVELSTGYANLCDCVIAPSESAAAILRGRGVHVPIRVIPTGVDLRRFAGGNGAAFRAARGIPPDALVVGHVGRLSREKNLEFLARAVRAFLERRSDAVFLAVGAGPAEETVRRCFEGRAARRLVMPGVLEGKALADAYRAMDVFAFASMSETQGLVLAEAMAAGVPVVALDAPGAREVVVDGRNGFLLDHESEAGFAEALERFAALSPAAREAMRAAAGATAARFSAGRCAAKAIALYKSLLSRTREVRRVRNSRWEAVRRLIGTEWELWANRAHAAGAALGGTDPAAAGP